MLLEWPAASRRGSHRLWLVASAFHAGGHFWRAVSARGETVVVDVFFRRAFAEPREAVGKRQHHVARHGVEPPVLNVVCRHAARHVFLLLQQVVCLQCNCRRLVFEKFV